MPRETRMPFESWQEVRLKGIQKKNVVHYSLWLFGQYRIIEIE